MIARPSRSAASALMISGIVMRVFYGLTVESPEVQNGAWLSVLIGAALALPLVRALSLCASSGRLRRPLSALMAALIALDAAQAIDITAYSAGYAAFAHVATALLMLPLLATALWAMIKDGEAIGNAALLLWKPVAALILLLAALQIPSYRPGWLAPIFGFGLPGILRAGLRTAGWMTVLAGAMLVLSPEEKPPLPFARNIVFASLACAGLILLRLMIAPALDGESMGRLNQLDALLTNGRSALYLQLPMISAWFLSLLNLICLECWAARALLEQGFGLGPSWSCGIAIIAIGLLAIMQVAEWGPMRIALDGQFLIIIAVILIMAMNREPDAH